MAQVNKNMTIKEVLDINSETGAVFMGFGMHCISCPVSSGETIEQAAEVHGIDPEELINKLNEFLAN